jgi:hypothetical protein
MRHGAGGRRSRNRGHGNRHGGGGGGGGGNRMQVFDSNGPDVRIRGTAHQIFEKYTALAKDAASMGDRVLSESYLQHAEHYQRIISTFHDNRPAQQPDQQPVAQQQPVVQQGPAKATGDDLALPASMLIPARADGVLEDA